MSVELGIQAELQVAAPTTGNRPLAVQYVDDAAGKGAVLVGLSVICAVTAVVTLIFLTAALATMAAALVIPLTLGVIAGVFFVPTVIVAVRLGIEFKNERKLNEKREQQIAKIKAAPIYALEFLMNEKADKVQQRFTDLGMDESSAYEIGQVYQEVKGGALIWRAFSNRAVHMGDFREVIKRELWLIKFQDDKEGLMLQNELKEYFNDESEVRNRASAYTTLAEYYSGHPDFKKLFDLEFLKKESTEQVKERFIRLGMHEESASKIAKVYQEVKDGNFIWRAFGKNDVIMGSLREIIKPELWLIKSERETEKSMLEKELKGYFKEYFDDESQTRPSISAYMKLAKYYSGHPDFKRLFDQEYKVYSETQENE